MNTYTVTLDKPHTFTRHYETAAWYTNITCQPQTVDVERRWSPHLGAYLYAFALRGVVADNHTPTLLGGVGVSSRNPGQGDVGKEQNYTITMFDYEFESRFATGSNITHWWADIPLRVTRHAAQ